MIDWVDFVQFGGIRYLSVAPVPGRTLTKDDLGPLFATIKFKLDGNVFDPNYHAKDGDAAFLAPGTKVYSVKSYQTTFRLAVYHNATTTLYEADSNSRAKHGGDLLDIGGKVRLISINDRENGTTQLAVIKVLQQVTSLVQMVLQAPVNQNLMKVGNKCYLIVFYLMDNTTTARSYCLDTAEMSRGIWLPKAFGEAVQQALGKKGLTE